MKRRLSKVWNRFKRLFTDPTTRVISVVTLFAIIGTTLLLLTHAALQNGSVETERGQKNGTVACDSTSNASNNDCVQFGSSSNAAVVTALTVVGTDNVVSSAICIDSAVAAGTSKVTACIQVNPGDTNQARGGTYDIAQKKFVPGTGWSTLTDVSAASKVATRTCASSGHSFYALGPLGPVYYGEEVGGGSGAFGTIDGTNSCATGGGGALAVGQWATPAVYCSGAAFQVASLPVLITAVASSKSEICVAPGTYTFTANMGSIAMKAGMKVIGQSPLQRPVFDSSALPQHNAQGKPLSTGSFTIGGANTTIANVTVQGAQIDSGGVKNRTCVICGNGIDGGDGIHLYNVKMANNGETGFHWNHTSSTLHYILENSELSNNGNDGDRQWSSAGFKTTGAGLIQHNVAINNDGNGLWCDGNDQNTAVCHGGEWKVFDNYVAGNWGPGIHFEIAFKQNPGADIERNVANCNNVTGKSYLGGITVFGAYATVSNNIFDNRNGADIPAANRCTDGFKQAVYVYNDLNRVPPFTHDVTVKNNTLNGDHIDCTPAITQGAGIVCTPNN